MDFEIPRLREVVLATKDKPGQLQIAIGKFYDENRSALEDIIRPTYSDFSDEVIRQSQAEIGNDADVERDPSPFQGRLSESRGRPSWRPSYSKASRAAKFRDCTFATTAWLLGRI